MAYFDAAGNAMPAGTTGVARFTAWGSPAGTIRQDVSDGHYEPTLCSGINARFDSACIADGVYVESPGTDHLCLDRCWVS